MKQYHTANRMQIFVVGFTTAAIILTYIVHKYGIAIIPYIIILCISIYVHYTVHCFAIYVMCIYIEKVNFCCERITYEENDDDKYDE